MKIEPQMAKLSVRDMLEAKERLEVEVTKLLNDFADATGVRVKSVEMLECAEWVGITDRVETAKMVAVKAKLAL